MALQPVWTDFVSGSLTNDLPSTTAGSTQTMTSAGLTTLAAVNNGTQFAKIVLDPFAVNGLPELVFVLSHTASSNTATIQRQSGQPLRDHPPSETWVHGPTAEDFTAIYGLLNTFTFQMQQVAFTTGTTSGSTELTLGTLNISSQIAHYYLECAGFWTGIPTVTGDIFKFRIRVNGTEVANIQEKVDLTSGVDRLHGTLPTTTIQSINPSTPVAVTYTVQRTGGSGSISYDSGSFGGLVTGRLSFFT